MQCREPENSKEVRSFLGSTSHFADRIPYHATTAIPLRELTKKNKPFKWTAKERKAFEKLKASFIHSALANFNPEWLTELIVDAGPDGCAVWLTQTHPDDAHKHWSKRRRNLISCASKAFTSAERNYSQLEKEAFAIVWAIEHYHIYTYGRYFEVLCDNDAVVKIYEENKVRKRTPMRFQRWKSRLSYYKFKLNRIPGEQNMADFLSRNFPITKLGNPDSTKLNQDMEASINRIIVDNSLKDLSIPAIIEATNNDETLKLVKHCIQSNKNPKQFPLLKPYLKVFNELTISSDGIVLRNDLIVYPQSMQSKVIELAHEGHMGMTLCKRFLRNRCWFPLIDKLMEQQCENCVSCVANHDSTHNTPIIPTEEPNNINELISFDFSSRTPTGDYLLVGYEYKSHYPSCHRTAGLETEDAIAGIKKTFEELNIKKGQRITIRTDQGPAFNSAKFEQFVNEYNLVHLKSIQYHPQSNGAVERFMRSINKVIRASIIDKVSWKQNLKKFLSRYRSTPHTATGVTPDFMMFGEDKFAEMPSLKNQSINNHRAKVQAYQSKMKFEADTRQKVKQNKFKLNDIVLLKWHQRSNKFQSLFDPNPYKITKIRGTKITAARADHVVHRHVSKFKRVKSKSIKVKPVEEQKPVLYSLLVQQDEEQPQQQPQPQEPQQNSPQQQPQQVLRSRPTRASQAEKQAQQAHKQLQQQQHQQTRYMLRANRHQNYTEVNRRQKRQNTR